MRVATPGSTRARLLPIDQSDLRYLNRALAAELSLWALITSILLLTAGLVAWGLLWRLRRLARRGNRPTIEHY